MWRIRKDNIKLAEVIVLDQFLQRYTVVRLPIHEFLQLAQSTLRKQMVELQYPFVTCCRKSSLKTSQLNCLLNVIKRFIQLARVIIDVLFLQRYI